MAYNVADRFLARSAVFVALRNNKQEVLLLRRANTGYMDGRYDLPSGHVERGESLLQAAARELKEETDIAVKKADLWLWHINQFSANDHDYYNFFFVADVWQGTPKIMETDKYDNMRFFLLKKLPKLTAGSHLALVHPPTKKVSLGFIDQTVYDNIAND